MCSPVLLCVDYSQQLLQVRKTNLEKMGFTVVTATSVTAALVLLEEMPIDAVVIEYSWEGMDSGAVAFHLKRRHPRLPIILLSAYSDVPQRILSLVDDCIMKNESPRIAQVVEKLAVSDRRPAGAQQLKSYHATA